MQLTCVILLSLHSLFTAASAVPMAPCSRTMLRYKRLLLTVYMSKLGPESAHQDSSGMTVQKPRGAAATRGCRVSLHLAEMAWRCSRLEACAWLRRVLKHWT